MEKLKTNIRQAVIDLTLSYKTAENLITAFHKVWVWKQPKLDDEGHIDF